MADPVHLSQAAQMKKRYTRDRKVGEGTYAVVYLGTATATGRKVAIKKIKVGALKMGLDMSAIREVKFLRELRHENIIELVDVFASKANLNLILEFLTSDLEMLINDRNIVFSSADIKSWTIQSLRGLHHIHSRFILHRDLKPSNLLIAPNGVLKLADFGLARDFASPFVNMTPTVVTRWYRAPELLYGARSYSTAIDIWSIGCIFAELMLRVPYMAGDTDLSQLDIMFKALGPPSLEEWPDMVHLPDFQGRPPPSSFPAVPTGQMEALFTAAGPHELSLLRWMLRYNPHHRPTAKQALESAYFKAEPRPTPPEHLPKKGGRDSMEHVVSGLKRPADLVDSPGSKVARKLEF